MSRKIEPLVVTVDSELLNKYKYICEYFKHNINDQLSFTLMRYVNSFEEIHGPIEITKNNRRKKNNKIIVHTET